MYVRMLQTIGTALSAFVAGTTYDVADDTGKNLVEGKIAVETAIPPEWVADLFSRMETGAGRPCTFLPHLGEFGHRIVSGIRIVHFHRASEKIVCCRPGEEVLYPSASGFVTDWIDPTPDRIRAGTMTSPAALWSQIIARFPNHLALEQGGLTRAQEIIAIHPEQRIPFRPRRRGLRAEVLIGVRHREFHREKNFAHWQEFADALRAEGITFATIGDRRTSSDLRGQEWHSGDFDTDAAIEGIQSCRVFVSSDTGSAHLAASVGCRQLVFREEFFGRSFIPNMRQINPSIQELRDVWKDPRRLIERTIQIVREVSA